MTNAGPDIIKTSGEKVKFSFTKLRRSLKKSGASDAIVSAIINEIKDELYQGISTKELYNRAYAMLKDYRGAYASRYSLKKAIYELGPSGFAFEKYVAEILRINGYKITLNPILQGKCVTHEIDIIATRDSGRHLIECKFHSEEGRKCDVKIPLYIKSRFDDIYAFEKSHEHDKGWLVTNTQFTQDALSYGKCAGLKLLSWNYPEEGSLKELIDKSMIYPVTSSTILSSSEKQFLLDRGIILGSQLLNKDFLLDHSGISEERKKRIISEFRNLCNKELNA
ncbi:restriction endonuclease [Gramella lutea]|uniref:Restriction endonuclease n=1 Tax=Christiangramia lutea TaxID=1607951 RepID=A0A9X2AA61_9FLAO|nr:restriction endonuclease [Christiangramia lutea]MCH4824379.1 restriction endonuclease [Christiangramia lutea]